jgi:hypothetical protein
MGGGPVNAALEAIEVEALVTDRYLEALLQAAEHGAPDAPSDPALDPALRSAALRLRDELVRVHPSFRFEERLARRLAEAAAGLRLAATSGGDATVIPFPARPFGDANLADELANPDLAALLGAPDDAPDTAAGYGGAPAGYAASAADGAGTGVRYAGSAAARPPVHRPLLVGGAVTSAALSLAGAAFVAWRLTRGAPTDPMARAVRLARAARAGRDILPGGLS